MIWAWSTLTMTIFSVMISAYYLLKSAQTNKATRRIEPWFEDPDIPKRRSWVFGIGDWYDRSELSDSLRQKLLKADINLKASEYAGIGLVIFIVLSVLNSYIFNMVFPINLIMALFIVWGGSTFFLKNKQNKRSEAFNKQLPEVCRMMSNTVKAGLTIQQGIQMVSDELKEPIGPEFKSLSQQLRLGDNFEDVMNGFKQRVESKELNIFISTIIIQRRVGGNLAEVLYLMAETLEERGRVNKEIDTVTAEQKTIAFILPIVPVVMLLMMNILIEGFLYPLFTPLGLILFMIFLAFQLLGFYLIQKVSKIRV